MRNHYQFSQKSFYNFKLYSILALFLVGFIQSGLSQFTYTFTNAGATGANGPTQTQINAAYLSTNLNGNVTIVTQGIQQWTVPVTGAYRIHALGAQGGPSWGMGASIAGDFTLTAGTVLRIVVGQLGGSSNSSHGSGGGGSFVATGTVPLIVAGGGGGRGASSSGVQTTSHGGTTTAGQMPPGGGPAGTGGGGGGAANSTVGGTSVTPGGGSTSSVWSSGGGGFYTNGGMYSNNTLNGGRAFLNNALGGDASGGSGNAPGGFGGGGGCGDRGAGGGGYSGGSGATSNNDGGGGGGSFNSGINQTNIAGANTGHGRVIITQLCDVAVNALNPSPSAPVICNGASITLTTNATTFTWSTGNTTTNSITVTPSVTTTYSVAGLGTLSCQGAALITVTVSPAAPALTVATTNTNICLGQSVVFTASGALTYTWSNNVPNGTAFQPSASAVFTVSGQNGCGITTETTAVIISPLAVSIVGPTAPVCAGSISTLVVSAAANSFTWQPTGASSATLVASPSSNTIYSVTVSNGTCIGTGTYAVNTMPLPTITAVASATTICDGESVVLTASGGLNYNWTPGNLSGASITVTPNSPIQYSVSGSNVQGCDAGAAAVIIVYPAPTLVLSTNDPLICNGSSATLNVAGAANYTWSNNSNANSIVVNPTQSTVYSVIGTNNTNTCSSTSTISVDVFTPLVTITGNTAICSGATTTLVASGATSYTWSNGVQFSNITVSPTANTVYTLSAISASNTLNCPSTTTIEVTIKANPAVVAVSDRPEICKNETVVVNASGANTYLWSTSATTSSISVTSTLVTTVIINVTGTGANGCTNTATVNVKINACNGLTEMTGNTNLMVYPNPASSEVNISFDAEIELMVISQTGQIVKVLKLIEANGYRANVNGLSNGVYFITGKTGDKNFNEKLVILK